MSELSTTVGVHDGVNIDEVTNLIRDALGEVKHINTEADPIIHLKKFGEESLLLTVACRLTSPEHEEDCLDELNRSIYRALSGDELIGPAI